MESYDSPNCSGFAANLHLGQVMGELTTRLLPSCNMRITVLLLIALCNGYITGAQIIRKQLHAERTTFKIKIDGVIDDAAWKEAKPVDDFIEQRPTAGRSEDPESRTVFYILYDNTSVYLAGYCYERTKDSISKELIGRDKTGANDLAGVILDTYNDKINAVGFFVTPYGEQHDRKYTPDIEDLSWNAVWESETRIHDNGWSFEMRIPYSALRFVSRDNQTWGINFLRRRLKTGQQFTWNPINPNINGMINQEGEWTGIGKVNAPVRLSFSPYLSSYLNHYKPASKDWNKSVNGGMDVKYGISESFTLDMTLVPDFGQVQSDNQILNLSPFEVRYNENRAFFTEGTELFNKGNLFYSRRVGGMPIHFRDVYNQLQANETVIRNPQESKLINATKISGRTKNGLGIGFFNALTKPTYAEIQDDNKVERKFETNPLTNYNIVVLDQTLKNNSSVSLINTNVLRNGSDYDANVTAALFSLNNKKNKYNFSGKLAVSQLNPAGKALVGYTKRFSFGKTAGQWNFQVYNETADNKYNINDMGILLNNNFNNAGLWTGYRWMNPTRWYNRIQINYNANHSSLLNTLPGQTAKTKFQSFSTNVNADIQLKNQWAAGIFVGYGPAGNDFYEPRQVGYSFRTTERFQFSSWFQTNSAKKYFAHFHYFVSLRTQFHSRNQDISLNHRYRFSDKFSLTMFTYINPFTNDAGFYFKLFEIVNGRQALKDIIFSRRDRTTIENVVSAKYNFNNKSGITIRARHYWSKVKQKQLYDLQPDGRLIPTAHNNIRLNDNNFNIFNVDAVYTWEFGPGSFINIVWKKEAFSSNNDTKTDYFKNLDRTLAGPHNNNLSFKIIYFLDYLYLKATKVK